MDKLPPPPPPPPPGRGRADGPQPPRDHAGGRRRRYPPTGRPSTWPRWLLWVIAGVLLATIFVPSLLPDDRGNELNYTEFRDKVVAGDVRSVEVNRTSGKISGELDNGDKFFTNGGTDRGLSRRRRGAARGAGGHGRVQVARAPTGCSTSSA